MQNIRFAYSSSKFIELFKCLRIEISNVSCFEINSQDKSNPTNIIKIFNSDEVSISQISSERIIIENIGALILIEDIRNFHISVTNID